MQTTSHRRCTVPRVAAACVLAAIAASCGIDKQSAPPLAGPSEYATSVTLRAAPDVITQDGQSQSAITATVRDWNGRPMPGVTLRFAGTSSSQDIRVVNFTQAAVVTDANGQATTGLISPPPPAEVPDEDPVITVQVVPVSSDFANAINRVVQVRLLAPPGTPTRNAAPTAAIVANPTVTNVNNTIRFDASQSTDEGQVCGSNCTYTWQFGDGTPAVTGMTVEHAFTAPGDYSVTVTVVDGRGGVDTATVVVTIVG